MSKCIGTEGEYSDHEPGDHCPRCGAFNEDHILAERDRLAAENAELRSELAIEKHCNEYGADQVRRLHTGNRELREQNRELRDRIARIADGRPVLLLNFDRDPEGPQP